MKLTKAATCDWFEKIIMSTITLKSALYLSSKENIQKMNVKIRHIWKEIAKKIQK